MAIRSMDQLRTDQSALLAEFRARFAFEQAAAGGVEFDLGAHLGQVTSIVTSDPTYGAHLVIQPQSFAGMPPVPSPAATAAIRAYPTPNHVVDDYSINEYVSLVSARGALLAVKFS